MLFHNEFTYQPISLFTPLFHGYMVSIMAAINNYNGCYGYSCGGKYKKLGGVTIMKQD